MMQSPCPARNSSRKLRRLFEPVVPNQANCALPIWVQKPFLALWRAPVSSTVIHAALVKPARSSRGLHPGSSACRHQQANDLSLGDDDAEPAQQRDQSRRRDLSLMILGEHEAAQFRSEMTIDARRQGGH